MGTILDIMTPDPVCFRADTSVEDAVRTLMDHHISGAPVVDGEQRIVGVLSEVDLLKLFWEKSARTVGEIMTPDPTVFPEDAPVEDVVDCLLTHHFRRVLIHDTAGRCVGLVSRADLMPSVLDAILSRRSV